MNQATIGGTLRFEGVGLHTGAQVRVELRPAKIDAGVVFDLGGTRVPALAEYVLDTSRATVLGRDGASVSTVEHVLSALFGLGVSNVEIAVDGPEIPVEDGSAERFVEAITAAGIVEQGVPRATLSVDRPKAYRSGDRCVVVLPCDAFRVRFVADFPAPVGTQYFDGEIDPSTYRREIAGARTFGYLREVEALRARGLALGGSLENALVFDEDGPLQPLRWQNEVVRHKVLDLIGDFALLGAWPLCEIVAVKSGHELHSQVTREMRASIHAEREAS